MTTVRVRGEQVRRFVVENLNEHSKDIAKVAAAHFKISRQAINKHLQRLQAEGAVTSTGETRNRTYALATLSDWHRRYRLEPAAPAEDVVWRNDIEKALGTLPDNVMRIWHVGFTEMFNNAIDHSDGTHVTVRIIKTAVDTTMSIRDDGVGIFRKIQTALGLLDERHAVLELSKGKFTTDPANHSGEGIFFTSRMFDDFAILSGDVHFSHEFGDDDDWVLEAPRPRDGTFVRMRLSNHTARTPKKIYDQFTSGDDIGFTKTVVPVRLAQYGDENLVSRSQAKRLLARIERFKTVLFDFRGVPSIGQSFADEIFRVFQQRYPDIRVVAVHASTAVKRMMEHVTSNTKT